MSLLEITGELWRCGHAKTAANTARGKCRSCKNRRQREHYQRHHEEEKAKSAARQRALRLARRGETPSESLSILREAVCELLSHRVGELPGQGWFRDNDQSRAAIARLAELVT